MDILLDNTSFSYLTCEYKFQKRVIQGITEPRSDPTDFGDAVHKAFEYRDRGLARAAMDAAVHKACPDANVPKALTVFSFLESTLKLPPAIQLLDGSPAVEVKFKHLYCSTILPGLAELLRVYLVGTIDRIYYDAVHDCLVIMDYKTTAAASGYAIDKVLSDYSLSFQLPFYFYALYNFGILPASYLEYLKQRKYRMEIILICHNTSPPKHVRHIRPAFNEDYVSREIPLVINQKIQHAIAVASLQSQAPKTGFTVYKACANCGYRPACLSSGEAREQEILSSYERKPYNPLTFR